MGTTFQHAAMPDAYRVSRYCLHPLRVGHALLMQRLENPYGQRPGPGDAMGEPQLGHLALAVWICTRDPDEGLASLQRNRSPRGLAWIAWRIKQYGIDRAHVELLAYLRAHWPEMSWWKQKNVPTRTLGADFMHRLVLTQRRMGLTLDGAMQTPLAVAIWDLAAVAEENGALSLVSDRDRAMQAYYETMIASGDLPAPGTPARRN